MENALTKVCDVNWDDWDLRILATLCAYMTTCKKTTGQRPFMLVYGKEAIMLIEFVVPSLCVVATTGQTDSGIVKRIISKLMELEEDRFVTYFSPVGLESAREGLAL